MVKECLVNNNNNKNLFFVLFCFGILFFGLFCFLFYNFSAIFFFAIFFCWKKAKNRGYNPSANCRIANCRIVFFFFFFFFFFFAFPHEFFSKKLFLFCFVFAIYHPPWLHAPFTNHRNPQEDNNQFLIILIPIGSLMENIFQFSDWLPSRASILGFDQFWLFKPPFYFFW